MYFPSATLSFNMTIMQHKQAECYHHAEQAEETSVPFSLIVGYFSITEL